MNELAAPGLNNNILQIFNPNNSEASFVKLLWFPKGLGVPFEHQMAQQKL